MNALDVINNIVDNDNLYRANLKYCLVSSNKHPLKIDGTNARPNNVDDFTTLEELLTVENLSDYAGLGISIQASNICAIDVDKCFSESFNISSGDARAQMIIEMFQKYAYIEFSFSGKGLRVLFRQDLIPNYIDFYYIKNEKFGIEYYQPFQSYRYVTITGRTIFNNPIDSNVNFNDVILEFLNIYMKRVKKIKEIDIIKDDKTVEQLMKTVKSHYITNHLFQDIWFSRAPGSGSDESERDFYLLSYLYEHVTQNKEKLKYIFEQSPFFRSKDYKHVNKWTNQNYRYYNYLYERIRRN